MVYAGIAETDQPREWSRYHWPAFDAPTLAAFGNFRFSASYRAERRTHAGSTDGVAARELFFPFPSRWGLRGDAFLWGKLAAFLDTDLKVETDLGEEFRQAFEHLTGREFDRVREDFHDPGVAHGGMSSGGIGIEWWRREGFPLLERRFENIRAALPSGEF